jgi:hypothetical protein
MKILSKAKSFCSNVVHGPRGPSVDTSPETSLNDSVKDSYQRKQHGKLYTTLDRMRKPFRKRHIPHLFSSTEPIPPFGASPISLTNTEIGPISFGSWDLEDFVRTYEVADQDLRTAHAPTLDASTVPTTTSSAVPSLTYSSSVHTSEHSGVSATSSISSPKTQLTDIELPPDNLASTSPAVDDCTRNHHISPVICVKQDRYSSAKLSTATIITAISSSDESIFSDKGSGGSSSSSEVWTEGQKDMDVDDDHESTTREYAGVDGEEDISIDGSATEDSKASSDTSSDESQAPLDRQEWDVIRQIPNSKFVLLLQSVLQGLLSSTCIISDCRVVARFGGGFNHIAAMVVKEDTQTTRYIIRVPAIGTASRWQQGDVHNMRCEMALLKHLRQHTNIPVPEVLAFSENLDSIIGAPFCLMKHLPGKPAHNVWFEDNKVRNHITANCISPKTEAKRQNLLRTLAQAMSELQTLSFNKIGAPDLTVPPSPGGSLNVTHSYRWTNPSAMKPEDLETSAQIYQYGPFDSSTEYMTSTIDTAWPAIPDPELADDPETQNILFGIRKILDIVYDQEPFDHSSTGDTTYEDETFVLRHPDLEFQNILVDDDGNVTGIIDWEGCLAVPRCVGYASVPDFLRRDWLKGTSLREQPYMCWTLQNYRQIYADAMRATGTPDAKYTAKSAMYRAVVDAVSSGAPMDLIVKLFRQIPGLRTVDVEEFEELLGAGWTKAEQFLEMEMRRLFEPEED